MMWVMWVAFFVSVVVGALIFLWVLSRLDAKVFCEWSGNFYGPMRARKATICRYRGLFRPIQKRDWYLPHLEKGERIAVDFLTGNITWLNSDRMAGAGGISMDEPMFSLDEILAAQDEIRRKETVH